MLAFTDVAYRQRRVMLAFTDAAYKQRRVMLASTDGAYRSVIGAYRPVTS